MVKSCKFECSCSVTNDNDKDVEKGNDQQCHDNTNMNEDRSKESNFKKAMKKAFSNMDLPLNRFLVCTGYYIIFVCLILQTVLTKNHVTDNSPRQFRTHYFFLTLYAFSMICNDFYTIFSIKGFKNIFKAQIIYETLAEFSFKSKKNFIQKIWYF